MKLGFYYHVPIAQKGNTGLYTPSYLGVFLDELAKNVGSLTLFMHQATPHEINELDYELTQTNINWVNLGYRKQAWHRSFFHRFHLKKHIQSLNEIDYLLVRGPSPLAPYFQEYIPKSKIVLFIVGDYKEGAINFEIKSLRDWLITKYLFYNDRKLTETIKHTKTFVNSNSLLKRYLEINSKVKLIKTTTLSEKDFYHREDTCKNEIIKILYTGRIDRAKGLFELVESIRLLHEKGFKCSLNIVGWEIKEGELVTNELKRFSHKIGIYRHIFFHGKKTVGEELNKYYRENDIYAIPSYHEGFPRTIWEAMANCLPVLTTPVGGIPEMLTEKENVIFVTPKSSAAICDGIIEIIKNEQQRKKMVKNGFELAKGNTLEVQTKALTAAIENATAN